MRFLPLAHPHTGSLMHRILRFWRKKLRSSQDELAVFQPALAHETYTATLTCRQSMCIQDHFTPTRSNKLDERLNSPPSKRINRTCVGRPFCFDVLSCRSSCLHPEIWRLPNHRKKSWVWKCGTPKFQNPLKKMLANVGYDSGPPMLSPFSDYSRTQDGKRPPQIAAANLSLA